MSRNDTNDFHLLGTVFREESRYLFRSRDHDTKHHQQAQHTTPIHKLTTEKYSTSRY